MARAERLSLRMICCPDALAEVITAATLTNQVNIPHADGQHVFPLLLQKSGQFGDEVREDVANEGMSLLHAGRVATAANWR
ncbi:hypothetical protein OHO83_09185 [Streptomyces sp. NBC_00569]|uniref:hypothetical protein n=1 Tax=Streptomyces sp. NBC_00569 TaxID=2975780 RepID=UPI002E80ABE2|nr:hypothetical protein [Streptomyces sp. NBC_00569]WUB92473.1 hypothetical protein OHO83_09185 [Streptomyces sp. NBC_00569]